MLWGKLEGGIGRVRTAIGGSDVNRDVSADGETAGDEPFTEAAKNGSTADTAVGEDGPTVGSENGSAVDRENGSTVDTPIGTGRLDWSGDDAEEVEDRLEALFDSGIEPEEERTDREEPPRGLEDAFDEFERAVGTDGTFEWVDAAELESAGG